MNIINTQSKVFEMVNQIIESSRFNLDAKVLDETYLDQITNFVNENYNDNKIIVIKYTPELIKYYLIDSIPIFFYSKNNNKIIALIVGKVRNVNYKNSIYGAIEVNFFCIIKPFRHMDLPKLLKSYLIRECINKYGNDIHFSYYTTSNKINASIMCKKKYYNRCINFDNIKNGVILSDKKSSSIYKKLYSKFIYPENFKNYTIINFNKYDNKLTENEIDSIIEKIESYQNINFDFYEIVNKKILIDILESSVFEKFLIKNNDEIIAFIIFYKMEQYNNNVNKSIRSLYLYYHYVNDTKNNIKYYLELIGEYMKNNNICDLYATLIFDNNSTPERFFEGSILNYYLWNATMENINENKMNLLLI